MPGRNLSTNRADKAMSDPLERFRKVLPMDWIIAYGDRIEMLRAVGKAFSYGYYIAHVGGGETDPNFKYDHPDHTQRNAISAMSDLHFAFNDKAASNLREMSVVHGNIYVTGSPALDDIVRYRKAHPNQQRTDTIIVSINPMPWSQKHEREEFGAILEALSGYRGRVLWIEPAGKDDTGFGWLRRATREKVPEAWQRQHIDREDFLLEMATARCIIGNSSLMRVEASAFGTPCVEVGNRQRGRIKTDNVTILGHNNLSKWTVREELNEWSKNRFPKHSPWENPDGRAVETIVELLESKCPLLPVRAYPWAGREGARKWKRVKHSS